MVLLVIEDQTITPDEQMAISQQLVEQRCRYAVAFGHAASSWDDSIDYADILRYPNCSPPDDALVMTTWHDRATVDEIAQFFVYLTAFDSFTPVTFLLLCRRNTHLAGLSPMCKRRNDFARERSSTIHRGNRSNSHRPLAEGGVAPGYLLKLPVVPVPAPPVH